MDFITPPALRPGSRIAVLSLSAGVAQAIPARYETGKRQLRETFDVDVVDGPNALRDHAWLRAHPQARAEELHLALTDSRIDGIITAIGGDDSIRIAPHLDLELIRAHPKIFMGFSDTTAQHLVYQQAGVVSFYGPSVMTGFAETGGMDEYTIGAVRRALFSTEPIGELTAAAQWTEDHDEWTNARPRRRRWFPNGGWVWLQGGPAVTGRLAGGCIEVMEMAKATPSWPEDDYWDGAILHLELSEDAPPPAQIQYWMRNYAAAGVLGRIGALLLSRPMDYSLRASTIMWQKVMQVVDEAGRSDLPVVANLDYGHTSPMGVLPLGVRARVDAERATITVLDAGVC